MLTAGRLANQESNKTRNYGASRFLTRNHWIGIKSEITIWMQCSILCKRYIAGDLKHIQASMPQSKPPPQQIIVMLSVNSHFWYRDHKIWINRIWRFFILKDFTVYLEYNSSHLQHEIAKSTKITIKWRSHDWWWFWM